MSDSDDDEITCPLCIQPLDATDKAINYCACGFQMCLWCWHKLMETAQNDNLPGRCPNCRTIYDKEKIEMHAITPELLEEERRKKKEERKKGKGGVPKNKQDLAHIRVVQRNLVYAVGLPLHVCREETLAEKQYFGQFGKTKKISVNRAGMFAQGPTKNVATGSAYVTFARNEDAMRCIDAIDGAVWDGKPIRACFGTTKYCNAFLKGVTCNNPDCLYLHDIANEDDSFNKDDMTNGTLSKHIMQLVQPGERNKTTVVAKAPLPPAAHAAAANGAVAHAEPSTMTQLGKPQAGPSHVNPWLQHSFHTAAAEGPQSPVRGAPKPPGPNLAEQEWPSLHAAADDHLSDRPNAADDTKATTSSFTAALSTASSLSGETTVADAVKAAIAAATATKPTTKQAAAAKPSTQTITLTKPVKAKTATVVAAAKAKAQVPPATPPQPEASTSSSSVTTTAATPSTKSTTAVATTTTTTTAAVTTAAAIVAATSTSRESRVAAAVEAALQPPSPSPSYQQAAAGATVATKTAKTALANGKTTASCNTTPPTGTDAEAGDAVGTTDVAPPASSQEDSVHQPVSSRTLANGPVSTSDPQFTVATQSSTDPHILATTSSAEAHPLSHTSSMSSELSAVAGDPKAAESAAGALGNHNEAESQIHANNLRAGLISSSDPPVSPPSNIVSNMSSASLAGWLGAGDTTANSTPTATPHASASPSIPTGLNATFDTPVPLAMPKPAVPPGFGAPAAGSTLLKQPSLGSAASTRGPPPGFSQPWLATAPAAAPTAPAANPFDVNMYFTADPVADAAGTGRKQSRFRFAQNGAAAASTESDPTPPTSDLHLLGLPGVDESRAQGASEELSLFRKIFPTAKLNIMPGTSQPQQHIPGINTQVSTPPWPMPTQQLPPEAGNPPHLPPRSANELMPNGSPATASISNPGFALLQQLQRASASRTDPTLHLTPQAPSAPLPIPSSNLYAPAPQVSQPTHSSFLDPAIINAKAAPELGPSPPTHSPVWPPGFASVAMQYAPPSASMQLSAMVNGSQPMMFAQQQQAQQAQQAGMLSNASLSGLLRQPQPNLLAQQQPQQQQGYPLNVSAVRPQQQRGPPPGFTPGTTNFNTTYTDYSNAYNVMQQARAAQQANPHLYGVGDHYQAANSHLSNPSDVNKGYLFPTRI